MLPAGRMGERASRLERGTVQRSQSLATSFAVVLLAVSADAQVGPHWMLETTVGPAPRNQHAMSYDSQRGRVVMFGGDVDYPGVADTWEWDGNTWIEVATTGPSEREYHVMAYDSDRGRTVMFGGYHPANLSMDDTWEWDGEIWTLAALGGPTARDNAAMAYDSRRQRVVLFGGGDFWGDFGDTWEWDGVAWTQVATTGPSPRSRHAMVWDSQRERIVLFGGRGATLLSDTWEWDGTSWSQVAAAGPVARYDHEMAFDAVRGATVLFGGKIHPFIWQQDTWEWDGASWADVTPATGPAGRAGHAMAYDNQRGKTVMFGGYNGLIHSLHDTWEWQTYQLAYALPFGAGCGAPELSAATPASARPVLGTVGQVVLTNIPSPPSLAFVALGWNTATYGVYSLPLSLDGFGMPGCELLQSSDRLAEAVTITGPTTGTFGIFLPNLPGLLGVELFLQGWAHAPGQNPTGLITSNGIEWALGQI